ncbi:MAG: hypothetical protein NVS1B3_06320 [Candidatus Dormibacteraceae bacterium]
MLGPSVIRPATKDVIEGIENPISEAEVIANPISRQTVTFLSMTAQMLRTCFEVEPGGAIDPRHIHPQQVETVTVIEGRIRRSLPDKSEETLEAGQSWEIPAGTPHTWAALDGPVTLQIDFRPALRTQSLMTRLFGLAEAGKTNSKGMPNLLQVSVIALEYQRELRLANPPWSVQKVFLGALAPLARALGYRPD